MNKFSRLDCLISLCCICHCVCMHMCACTSPRLLDVIKYRFIYLSSFFTQRWPSILLTSVVLVARMLLYCRKSHDMIWHRLLHIMMLILCNYNVAYFFSHYDAINTIYGNILRGKTCAFTYVLPFTEKNLQSLYISLSYLLSMHAVILHQNIH